MSTADLAAQLADLAAQIDISIRTGQTPSNRAWLRHARSQLAVALSAMEMVNHSVSMSRLQGAN